MDCRHCGHQIRMTSHKLPREISVYIHTETNTRYCYDLKTDTYHSAQPR